MGVKSYRDLEIFQLAKELAVKVHAMTLKELPKFELYEEGSQIRHSSKSVPANIAEGLGRRKYKNEFLQFITYAVASCDETKVHLEILYETKSLNKDSFENLFHRYQELGAKLFYFREAVMKNHRAS